MTDSSFNTSGGRMPTDEQMDGLLREFFRLEMPCELNQPWQRPVRTGSGPVLERLPVVVQPVPRNRRLTVAVSIAALALLTVFAVRPFSSSDSNPSGRVAVPDQPVVPEHPDADGMLVSPNAGVSGQVPVGADGVTLDETDGVELNPAAKPRQ